LQDRREPATSCGPGLRRSPQSASTLVERASQSQILLAYHRNAWHNTSIVAAASIALRYLLTMPNAVGRQRAADQSEMISQVRSYLRPTQGRPEIVRNYFKHEDVIYAAA
jgi:hypothetical protein